MAPAPTTAPTAPASRDASPTAPRRRSERQLLASPDAAPRPPFKKPPRRSSKTDPTVKPLLFWTPDEVANLVQAWRDTIANPPPRARSVAGGFNARMYKRFVALCGGSTIRALQSAINKKQLLNNSFQFISQYNEGRASEVAAKAASGTSGSSGASDATGDKSGASGKAAAVASSSKSSSNDASSPLDQRNYWFELPKAQRKGVASKTPLTEQRQFALLNMNRATYESMLEITTLEAKLNVRQPWSDDEMALMFRAWRKVLTTPPKGSRNPLFSFNTRTYEFMAALGGDAFKRTKQSVVLKKESMRLSYEFIGQFNAQGKKATAAEPATTAASGSLDRTATAGTSTASAKHEPTPWFQLSQREQERIVAREFPKSGFVYFTEAQYRDLGTLFRDTERVGNEYGVRQGVMWTAEENALLVRAWREIVETPRERLRAGATIGACVYERFVNLTDRPYKRSERSTIVKLVSMERMHAFIAAYNEAAAREARVDWFSLARPDRRRTHSEATRANGGPEDRARTFTDFDRSLFAAVTEILAHNRPLSALTHGAKARGKAKGGKRSSVGSRRRSRGNDSDDESESEEDGDLSEDDDEDDNDGENEDEEDDVVRESPDGDDDGNGASSERNGESESDDASSDRSRASPTAVRSRRRLSLSDQALVKSKAKGKSKAKATVKGPSKANSASKSKAKAKATAKSKATVKAATGASDTEIGDDNSGSGDEDDLNDRHADDTNSKDGSDDGDFGDDSSAIDGLQTSDDEDVASARDAIARVAGDDRTASNSFLQVRHTGEQQQQQQQSALSAQSSEAGAAVFRSDGALDQDHDNDDTASEEDDGDEEDSRESVALPPSRRDRTTTAATRPHSTTGRSAGGRKTAGSASATAASTPAAFSLHELADLAMRVNTTADDSSSSSSDHSASARDHDAVLSHTRATSPQLISQPPHTEPMARTTEMTSSSSPKKRKLGSDLAAIVSILQTQSAQMTRVMEEIRDEIRRDREDRERFRGEMRRDRATQQQQRHDDDSSDDDDSDDEHSLGSRRQKKKHKSVRRLSVQRDGFVVRL